MQEVCNRSLGKVFGGSKFLLKQLFFTLKPAWRKILTLDDYIEEILLFVEYCCMYKKNGESVDRLLLHCVVAMVLCIFGLYQVMPRRQLITLACWKGSFAKHHNGDIWAVTPLYIMWIFWKEQNRGMFEGVEHTMLELQVILF